MEIWRPLASAATILAFCTVLEYVIHRWFMHRRASTFYRSHTVEHHGHGLVEEPRHADLTLWQGFVVYLGAAPLTALVSWSAWGWHWLAFAAACLWWPLAWSSTHRLIHGDRRYAYARLLVPWYPWVERHHLLHHRRWTVNYGGIFFWSDWLAGTGRRG